MNEKILSEITIPDRRWQYFNANLQDLKQSINEIRLADSVPDDIRIQINICKKLCLYSYFVYEFATVAMERSFMIIESALKLKYKKEDKDKIKGHISFKKLIDWAIKEKILNEKFPGMGNAIRNLRNSFAHPEWQQIDTPFNAIWHIGENVRIINSIFGDVK